MHTLMILQHAFGAFIFGIFFFSSRLVGHLSFMTDITSRKAVDVFYQAPTTAPNGDYLPHEISDTWLDDSIEDDT